MMISLQSKQTWQLLNVVLGIVLVICCVMMIYAFVVTPSYARSGVIAGHNEPAPMVMQPLADVGTFLKLVSSRELFRQVTVTQKQAGGARTIDELTRNLVLVGVVAQGNKEAIIKDQRTRQSYFVSVGSMVGDLKVTDIRDDKIEVSYEQQRTELYLQ